MPIIVLGLHFGFVLFALLGGLGALRWRWWPALHLPTVAWGAWIEFSAGTCPLTHLENALRRRAGEAGCAGDFIQHYLLYALYPDGLTPAIQTMLGAALLLINMIVYAIALRRTRGRDRARTDSIESVYGRPKNTQLIVLAYF